MTNSVSDDLQEVIDEGELDELHPERDFKWGETEDEDHSELDNGIADYD